jgi:hypothetical protein
MDSIVEVEDFPSAKSTAKNFDGVADGTSGADDASVVMWKVERVDGSVAGEQRIGQMGVERALAGSLGLCPVSIRERVIGRGRREAALSCSMEYWRGGRVRICWRA